MSQQAIPDWEAIKADYLARKLSVVDICLKHGISQSALMQRRLVENWHGRNKSRAPGRKQLVARMFVVLEKQIEKMEVAVMSGTDDKEIALLGQLVRSLEKLVELDTKQKTTMIKKNGKPPKSSRDMLTLRNKIAQRISHLEAG